MAGKGLTQKLRCGNFDSSFGSTHGRGGSGAVEDMVDMGEWVGGLCRVLHQKQNFWNKGYLNKTFGITDI